MVFIIEGMPLRIPKGALSISIDDSGNPQASLTALHVVYEVWPDWLEIALDHAELAYEVRQELKSGPADEAEKARLLIEECRAAMVAVVASATCLDAFYAGVSERLPSYSDLRSKWASQAKRPSRPGQVSQVFHRAFRYDKDLYRRLVKALNEVYKIRDAALHPSSEFRPPVVHDVLGVGVEWRFAAFTAPNGFKAASLACDIVHHSTGVPRASLPALGEWCKVARTKVELVHDRAVQMAADLS